MSILPFLVVTTVATLGALLARSRARVAGVIGGLGLVLAIITALAIEPGQVVTIGDSAVATTDYLRLALVLASVVGSLLALIGAATGSHREAPAVTLGILATSALALALADPRIAVLAATAGGAFGALLTLGPLGSRSAATVGTRVLRATIIAGTMAVAAMAWIGRDLSELAAQPVVFGLAYLAVALAVAIRFGAIPFHAWAARLADTVPETTLPLVTAVAPASLAVVALAWTDASIAPLLVDLDQVRAVVLAVAIGSIVLASVAAWIQDDIEHIVGYAIIGDAGVVLLAIAALDPEAWAPARTWILALIVTRSAFAAWAAATRTAFATGRVDELQGWAIRSPLLAASFVAVVVAGIGLPGFAAFDARASLVDLALDGPLATLVLVGTLSPLAYYGRLFAAGLGRPAGRVAGETWRPRIEALDLTDLPGWSRRSWDANRAVSSAGLSLVLAVLAIAVAGGAFGVTTAAAGLPPVVDGATGPEAPTGPDAPIESEPPVETEPPADTDVPAPSPTETPSFVPVPTP
jgi:formate hydrogenlyase subunit 3/multisubunit Na+/H+ antiporter MnhD subunit